MVLNLGRFNYFWHFYYSPITANFYDLRGINLRGINKELVERVVSHDTADIFFNVHKLRFINKII